MTPTDASLFEPGTISATEPDAIAVRDLLVRRTDQRHPFRPARDVLRGVDLRAPSGQITAIVGTNGAGKSTLIAAIAGALVPVSGSIEVLGEHLGPADVPLPPGVALVPDEPGYPDDWTADDVAKLRRRVVPGFDVRAFGRRLREREVPLDRPLRSLSRGQVTHLLVAAALADGPRLLILDEPFARLDPLARSELADDLRDVLVGAPLGAAPGTSDRPRSVLLTTHDLDGMDRLVDHLVVIDAGRTVLEGEVEDLREDHLLAELDEPVSDEVRAVLRGAEDREGVLAALVRGDDAAALPPDARLRRPTLPELVTGTLREARRHRAAGPRAGKDS